MVADLLSGMWDDLFVNDLGLIGLYEKLKLSLIIQDLILELIKQLVQVTMYGHWFHRRVINLYISISITCKLINY